MAIDRVAQRARDLVEADVCAGSPRRGTCGSACRRRRRWSRTRPRSGVGGQRLPGRVGAPDGREGDGGQREREAAGPREACGHGRPCPFSHPARSHWTAPARREDDGARDGPSRRPRRRGLIHDTTDRAALAARLAEGPITLYYGCDPTAPSLHVGNLIGLVLLRRFQDAGHRPDRPRRRGHRDGGRPVGPLRRAEPARRGRRCRPTWPPSRHQMARIVDLERRGRHARRQPGLDQGPHASSTSCGTSASTPPSTRCWPGSPCRPGSSPSTGSPSPSSATCSCRPTTTCWLHDHQGCELQVGGSDQWGNILSGVDLVRRARRQAVHAPVLAPADGRRRHEAGQDHRRPGVARSRAHLAVRVLPALDADRRRRPAPACSRQFTLLPMDEIDAVVAAHADGAGASGRASGASPTRSRPWSTAPRQAAAAAEAAGDPLRRRPPGGLGRTPWPSWRQRCPPRPSRRGRTCRRASALAPGARAGRAGRLAERGPPPAGRAGPSSVNGAKVDPETGSWGPRTSSTGAGSCSARASGTGPWSVRGREPRDLGRLELTWSATDP